MGRAYHALYQGITLEAAEKPMVLYQGTTLAVPLEFLHFRAANWPTEDIFPVFGSTNSLNCASPGL
jgi:hypothetical protein